MLKVKDSILVIILIFTFIPIKAYSNPCNDYPYKNGIDYIFKKGKFKIISSSEIEFPLEEKEFVEDLIEEAEFEATFQISEFIKLMNNFINKDENESIFRFNSSTKNIIHKKLIDAYKSSKIISNDKALRGAFVTNSCYEPGNIVRVTVELGSDSIDSAETLKSTLKKKKY